MTTIRRAVNLWNWDAREVFPDGLEADAAKPEELTGLLEKVGQAMASGGLVVVLPGPEPHQALVLSVQGPGEGEVVEGSVELDLEDG